MKIAFFASSKQRELDLAMAFKAGAAKHGYSVDILHNGSFVPGYDLCCMIGVKSIKMWRRAVDAGCHVMMFDKGYSRHRKGGCWEYWRVSLDGHHPTGTTLSRDYPGDRFDKLGFNIEPWRKEGDNIVIMGSSAKYHNFNRLPDPTTFATELFEQIRLYTSRPVIYRPKPSWKDAVEIPGTTFSHSKQPLTEVFNNCHAIVTHGSNACFEAALFGIPSIILGDAVMKPISSTDISEINKPKMMERKELFNALAYHQWTLSEFKSGLAFNTIKEWL